MADRTRLIEVELTVIFAKDLKNVNWQCGDLRPYALAWVDPETEVSTHVDLEGDTKPSWNEKLVISATKPLEDAELTIDIVHKKPSEMTKPLIGTARVRLSVDEVGFDQRQERTLKLKRSSGRPQGELEITICVKEKRWSEQQYPYPQLYATRDYAPVPPPAPYPYQQYPYGANPPPLQYPYGTNPPSGYPYVANPPPQGSLVPYGISSGYGSRPSYAYGDSEKPKGNKFGVGTGLAMGTVAGHLDCLALAEGAKYVEDKIVDDVADKVEDDIVD